MSPDEAKAWQAYTFITERGYPNSGDKDERFLEFQSIYEASNFDFQECRNIGDIWWPNYFAVESHDVIGLINYLTQDYVIDRITIDNNKKTLFQNPRQNFLVSPPCDGVIFIYWSDIQYNFSSVHHQNFVSMLQHDWADISNIFGNVFYISDAKHNPGFLYWRQGKLHRAIVGREDKIAKFGTEIQGEDLTGSNGQEFLVGMWKMAGNWNVWPLHMRPFKPDEKAYAWLVDG